MGQLTLIHAVVADRKPFLDDTQVIDDGVKKLRQALPKCQMP